METHTHMYDFEIKRHKRLYSSHVLEKQIKIHGIDCLNTSSLINKIQWFISIYVL